MADAQIMENAFVGLHDCRTDKVSLDAHSAVFHFPDGFYLLQNNTFVKTQDSEMHCRLCEAPEESFSVFVYRKNHLGQTIRENWSRRFPSAICSARYTFEFVETMCGYHTILFKGYLWSDSPPYHRECEITINTDSISYHWSGLE